MDTPATQTVPTSPPAAPTDRSAPLRRLAWFAIAVPLLAWPLGWGLAGGNTLAVDAISPDRAARGMASGFSGGWSDAYPPGMFYAVALAYRTADRLAGEPPTGVAPKRTRLRAGRAVSVAAALATVLGIFAVGRRLGLGEGAGIAALVWAGSPTVAYYAKTTNVESLYLALLVAGMACFVRAVDRLDGRWLALAGLCAAASAVTKDQAAVYFAFAPLALVVPRTAGREPARPWETLRGLSWRRLSGAAVATLVAYGALMNVVSNPRGVSKHFEELRRVSRIAAEFAPDLGGKLAQVGVMSANLTFVLGAPALALAVWGVIALRDRERRARHLLHLPAAAGYTVFLWMAVPRTYDRLTLPTALSLAWLAGEGAADLLRRFPARRRAVWCVLVAVVAFSLARGAELDLRLGFDSRETIAADIARDGGAPSTTWVMGSAAWSSRAGLNTRLGGSLYYAQRLAAREPRHLVAEADLMQDPRWRSAVRGAGYVEVLRTAGPFPARLTRPGRARTNLDRVSPWLVLYRRVDAVGGGETVR